MDPRYADGRPRGFMDAYLDPNIVRRATILPYGETATGEQQWAMPEMLVGLLKSMTLPGDTARGVPHTDDDVTRMALDIGGIGGAIGSAPGGSLAMGAARRSLPMDDASRLARAAEMGFDTSRPVYHGTATDFRAFDPKRSIGGQYWSTTDKASVLAGEVGAQGKGVIKEMYQNIKNPAGWKEYDQLGIDELISRGYDGLALPEKDGHVTYVAFYPNQYRDVRAKFDPAKANSANLMAVNASPLPAALPERKRIKKKSKWDPA